MAKKKVVKSGPNRKSTKSVAKKSVAKKSSKSARAQAGEQRLLTNDEIGHVAGQVWQLLTDENDRSMASIKKSIAAPDALTLASIGWLAREDKLEFKMNGRFTIVSLR